MPLSTPVTGPGISRLSAARLSGVMAAAATMPLSMTLSTPVTGPGLPGLATAALPLPAVTMPVTMLLFASAAHLPGCLLFPHALFLCVHPSFHVLLLFLKYISLYGS